MINQTMIYAQHRIFSPTIITASAVLAVLTALASCTKEQEAGAGAEKSPAKRLHARIEGGADTRVDFDEVSGVFSWTNGDQIDIRTTGDRYYTATLDGKGNFSLELGSGEDRDGDGYAIFPAGMVTSDAALTLELPNRYDITPGEDMLSPVPLIAKNDTDSDDLMFYHAGGMMMLTLEALPHMTERIRVTLDNRISGLFPVQFTASGQPYIETDNSDEGHSIYFVFPNRLTAERDIVLKFPVPTGTYESVKAEALDEARHVIKTYKSIKDRPMYRARGRQVRFFTEQHDSMTIEVTAGDDKGWTFTFPFRTSEILPADLVISWGDGTTTEVSAGSKVSTVLESFSHTYTSAGPKNIIISATSTDPDGIMLPYWENAPIGVLRYPEAANMLTSISTPLMKIRIMDGLYGADYMFYKCKNLKTVCADLFSKNTNISCFELTFAYSGLTSIPAGLFDGQTNARSLYHAFRSCTSLSGEIPAHLFDDCINVYRIEGLFLGDPGLTRIPDGLFDYCVKAETFKEAFRDCTGLSGAIPDGLFKNNPLVTTYELVFYNCPSLTGPIPVDLFSNGVSAERFNNAFYGCSGLTLAPAGLFGDNLNAYNFSGTFNGCSNLRASKDVFLGPGQTAENRFSDIVFDMSITAEKFSFYNCFKNTLGGIPETEGLTVGPAPELWNYVFGGGKEIIHYDCFASPASGGGWSNDADIPADWK